MKRAALRHLLLCTASSSSSSFSSRSASAFVHHQIRSGSTTTKRMASNTKNLVVDPFCFRQFKEHDSSTGYQGTVFNISIEKFEQIVNERYDANALKDGYAPFCKHIFIENDFTDARLCVLPITKE